MAEGQKVRQRPAGAPSVARLRRRCAPGRGRAGDGRNRHLPHRRRDLLLHRSRRRPLMVSPVRDPALSHPFHPLPPERLTALEGWAMLARSMGYVYRPSTLDGVREVLALARSSGRSAVPRGAGFSYGDASLNAEHLVLDLQRMNRVLDWDPKAGLI